mmetsp:Transcript_2571/g.7329  ORF Transcript_2571/g.7329 Transcript_2571/m.7329 type:complete len:214 (-) Transcript_2571:576-1217(-)
MLLLNCEITACKSGKLPPLLRVRVICCTLAGNEPVSGNKVANNCRQCSYACSKARNSPKRFAVTSSYITACRSACRAKLQIREVTRSKSMGTFFKPVRNCLDNSSFAMKNSTASLRSRISSTSKSGAHNHCFNNLKPNSVLVWFKKWSNEPLYVPSNVSKTSNAARAVASKTSRLLTPPPRFEGIACSGLCTGARASQVAKGSTRRPSSTPSR